jgi:pseudaminic acid cytidylyltransferase
MNIAVIPARGGSKRIPGKNIRHFAGVPMIVRSIRAAISCGLFDRVIVSTDAEAIADVAEAAGAEVPFLRPDELSDDHTPTAPVLAHAMRHVLLEGQAVEYACCIYATAPFIRAEDLSNGYRVIVENKVSSAFSVTSFAFPIFRALRISEEGRLGMFWPEHELTRSQDLPEAYHDAGQFYWVECRRFLETERLYGADAMPVVLPRHLVQDIDTMEDWRRAELMFETLRLAGEVKE